jgi:hypothetical protein
VNYQFIKPSKLALYPANKAQLAQGNGSHALLNAMLGSFSTKTDAVKSSRKWIKCFILDMYCSSGSVRSSKSLS